MKKIIPYKSTKYAISALDNGGRFYNIMSKANDGNISSAELAKVAGVFSSKQNMILYLEMSIFELANEAKREVLFLLSENLKAEYSKYKPLNLLPSEAQKSGVISSAAIITGIPKLIDSKTEFTGFIMIPVVTNKVTTFMMIPIIDQYDVYELKDVESGTDFFIAHNRSNRKLPKQLTRCGGVIKELKTKKNEESASDMFLEMLYYTPI